MFISKFEMSPTLILIFGVILQVVRATLMSILPVHREVIPAVYGYEIVLRIGLGINIAALLVLPPYLVEKRDQAVAMGAVVHFRIMGGALVLAIVTTILNNYVSSHLSVSIQMQQLQAVLRSVDAINKLSPTLQSHIRAALGHGYNLQMRVMIVFGAAQIPASLLLWGTYTKV